MKVIMKPIDMICWFTKEGEVKPIRFRIEGKTGEELKINIDRIIKTDVNKWAGNTMLTFTCQSVIEEMERVYEIRYEVSTNKWFMYKM